MEPTSQIREQMKVVGSDRQPVGTERIDGQQVCLRQKAQEARQQWQS